MSVCRLSKIKEWVDTRDPHALLIPFSASIELKVLSVGITSHVVYNYEHVSDLQLFDMPEDEQRRFCEEKKIQRQVPSMCVPREPCTRIYMYISCIYMEHMCIAH